MLEKLQTEKIEEEKWQSINIYLQLLIVEVVIENKIVTWRLKFVCADSHVIYKLF